MLKPIIGLVSLLIVANSAKEFDLDIREMEKEIQALKTEVKDLKQRVEVCEKHTGKHTSKKYLLSNNFETSPVAFSAYISNYLYGLTEHKILTFDSVILSNLLFEVDNAIVSSACAETIQSRHIDQGGNVVFVKLTKGQNIWVEVELTGSGNAHIESHAAWRFTTFSAVLLYEV